MDCSEVVDNLNVTPVQQKPSKVDGDVNNATIIGESCDQGSEVAASCSTTPLDVTKIQIPKSVHIPYILNGQLYEIQTQDGENVTVRCCHCPPDRVYRGSVRSTGNFHMHIKRRHPDLLGKLHDMKVTALLERRDRLMKNRKISYRGNRSSNSSNNKSRLQQPLYDELPKLKIKSAFQRHQFQQQQQQQQQLQHLQQKHEAASVRNWNIEPFVLIPISDGTNVTDAHPEPINYSLKPGNIDSINVLHCHLNGENNVKQSENTLHHQQVESSISGLQQFTNESASLVITDNSGSFDHASDVSHYARTVTSFGSHISVGNNQNTVTIVKDELLMPSEAIDLTLQNSSISSGIGSSQTNSTNGRSFLNNNAAGSTSSNLKFNELLQQVEISLKEIQREMHTRNQIETNRIILDIAKFKYIHPGFNFQF